MHYSFHPFIHSLFLHFLNLFFHSWSVAAGVMGSWSQSLSRSTCRLARYRYIQAILCSSFYRIYSDSVFLNEGSECMHLHLLLRFWFWLWFRTSKKSRFYSPLHSTQGKENTCKPLFLFIHNCPHLSSGDHEFTFSSQFTFSRNSLRSFNTPLLIFLSADSYLSTSEELCKFLHVLYTAY